MLNFPTPQLFDAIGSEGLKVSLHTHVTLFKPTCAAALLEMARNAAETASGTNKRQRKVLSVDQTESTDIYVR